MERLEDTKGVPRSLRKITKKTKDSATSAQPPPSPKHEWGNTMLTEY
jgi:hypothetical protein